MKEETELWKESKNQSSDCRETCSSNKNKEAVNPILDFIQKPEIEKVESALTWLNIKKIC